MTDVHQLRAPRANGGIVAEPPLAQAAALLDANHRRLAGAAVPLLGRWGPSPTAGEVELENVTNEVIEINCDSHPLQYFDLVVFDSAGATISARPYGNIFSPLGKLSTLRLAPGEKYTHNVSLLGNVPEEQRRPGDYRVQGVYNYNGVRAVSESITVHLPPDR